VAQFDVYRNPDPESSREIPYLLDVQSGLLEGISTRVVIPLVSVAEIDKPVKGLNPGFEIEGSAVILSTPELAGIPKRALGEHVVSLKDHRGEILAALDLLFTGI
jgi:toxin CcdB